MAIYREDCDYYSLSDRQMFGISAQYRLIISKVTKRSRFKIERITVIFDFRFQ
jgi:hypothetical protein